VPCQSSFVDPQLFPPLSLAIDLLPAMAAFRLRRRAWSFQAPFLVGANVEGNPCICEDHSIIGPIDTSLIFFPKLARKEEARSTSGGLSSDLRRSGPSAALLPGPSNPVFMSGICRAENLLNIGKIRPGKIDTA
jgi:hypothetical protein